MRPDSFSYAICPEKVEILVSGGLVEVQEVPNRTKQFSLLSHLGPASFHCKNGLHSFQFDMLVSLIYLHNEAATPAGASDTANTGVIDHPMDAF